MKHYPVRERKIIQPAHIKNKSGRRTIVVGHIPRRPSVACCHFLQRNGIINCEITGVRWHSADLVQEGLEVPCKYIFSHKNIQKITIDRSGMDLQN